MASIKKKGGGGGGGANWMDTYGDMVTLLLCFFVLLYSISTIEQDKWMVFIKSFNRDAVEDISEPQGPTGSANQGGGSGMPIPDPNEEVDEALDELYDFLVEYQESSAAAAESMSVSMGDNFVFISFDDAIFFDGNSSYLRPDGKAVLDTIIPALAQAAPMIDELTVLGHTAQGRPNGPNEPIFDRHLASDRATEVVLYLQQNISREILYPGRIVVKSFGQWRNIAPNDTAENRAKNRRVELVISGRDLENAMNDDFEKYYAMYEDVTTDDVINYYTTNGN